MKKYIVIAIFFGSANSVIGQDLMDTFTSNSWKGSGMLMGSKANYNMNWKRVLDEKFIKLEFRNERTLENGNKIVFNARAFYKIEGLIVTGTWFDSRGVSFPLKGQIDENELIINWGSPETEVGKTVYTLDETEIRVKDYILNDGKEFQFGNATYTKAD